MNALVAPAMIAPVTSTQRARIEATIEHLVALLDALDGDPDLELLFEDEPSGDDEPSLGWTYGHDGFSVYVWGSDGDDLELEDENDEDGW